MGIFTKEEKKPSPTSPCAQVKAAYNNCFNRWYSEKYVKGQWNKEECVEEWQKYRACLSEHLDDKLVSRFLEAEISPDDLGKPIGGGGGAPAAPAAGVETQ